MRGLESSPVEQYLLFDHTAYLKGIENIGTIALSEIIIYEGPNEPEPMHEVLQPPNGGADNSSRLFEI